jgi:antirestriction protein
METEVQEKISIYLVKNGYCFEGDVDDFIEDNYQGQHRDLGEYATELLNDTCFFEGVSKEIDQIIQSYFDFMAYGRDLEIFGDIFTIQLDGYLHVFWNH